MHRGARTNELPKALRAAHEARLLSERDSPLALFYDLDALDSSVDALFKAMPFQHAFAIKANPVRTILERLVARGMGLECASITEVEMAILVNAPASRVVFDSPCKSHNDLQRALALGVHVNCDSFEELDRVAELYLRVHSTSIVGIRINPLLGLGQIEALSVSDPTSKFGVPLTAENKARVLQCFRQHAFLTSLHAHVGSQGCSPEMLADGARILTELACEVGQQVVHLDIGGGLPANFGSDETTPTFDVYAAALRKAAPSLFDARWKVTTEFGRALVAKTGWVASFVEYVKEAGGRRIAAIHAGSDLFVRTCYKPEDFALRVQVFEGAKGGFEAKRSAPSRVHDVVGPLCFGGDKIARVVQLPSIDVGDVVVVRDAGANTLSLFSRHCSRRAPPVLGYRRDAQGRVDVVVLKEEEALADVIRFWGFL